TALPRHGHAGQERSWTADSRQACARKLTSRRCADATPGYGVEGQSRRQASPASRQDVFNQGRIEVVMAVSRVVEILLFNWPRGVSPLSQRRPFFSPPFRRRRSRYKPPWKGA